MTDTTACQWEPMLVDLGWLRAHLASCAAKLHAQDLGVEPDVSSGTAAGRR